MPRVPPESRTRFGPSAVLARTVDLINAAGPPAAVPATTTTIEDILRRYGEPHPEIREDELTPITAVLDRLFEICRAASDDQAAELINGMFRDYCTPPRLTDHDRVTSWHLHLDDSDDGPCDEWIATSGALALALLLAETGRHAWGVCIARDCGRLFVRTGPHRRRNACSDRCATRARVHAHRQRARRP